MKPRHSKRYPNRRRGNEMSEKWKTLKGRLLLTGCLMLLIGLGVTLYQIKYEVAHLEDRLAITRAQIAAEQSDIEVLTAEWAYRTRPSQLRTLSSLYLDLAPANPNQVSAENRIAMIPLQGMKKGTSRARLAAY